MADQWDTYITRQQNEVAPPPEPFNPFTSLLSRLFGNMGGQPGQIKADKRGMFTPSMLPMPVGPPTPINHLAIRNLLNSGVLRNGQTPGAVTPPPEPDPAPAPRSPLLSFLFGGGR